MARYTGFPLGNTLNTSDNTSRSFADQDNFTNRKWLGILGGNVSTSIIDTSLYGDITIEITLAPNEILLSFWNTYDMPLVHRTAFTSSCV